MNQGWWQNKYVWVLGLFGGLLNLIQPIIGVLIWPFYQPNTHILAILVASDQPKRMIFTSLNIGITIALLIFSWALVQYYRKRKETLIQQKLQQFIIAFTLLQIIRWEIPILHLADISQATNLYIGYLLLVGLIIFGMAWLYWQIGQSFQAIGQTSFANLWQLSGALMMIFEFSLIITQVIGWPLAGIFDQLINFILVYPIMFNSWHFTKAAR